VALARAQTSPGADVISRVAVIDPLPTAAIIVPDPDNTLYRRYFTADFLRAARHAEYSEDTFPKAANTFWGAAFVSFRAGLEDRWRHTLAPAWGRSTEILNAASG
jgi:hypothetical protein